MPSPSVAVRRRPFLAPLWLAAAAVLFTSVVLYGVVRASIAIMGKTTTVVVLRHAEKNVGVDDLDPVLSSAGQERALRLAEMLGEERIAAVYVTDTRRSQLTAAPLAARLGVSPTVFPGGDTDELLADIGERHVGAKVVVVAHSNTVPKIVATLSRGRSTPVVADDEYDALFVVTVTRFGPPAVLQLRY
jgi:phosphohistidine phosphatase SixA